MCEIGNLSTHITLRNLRPPGLFVEWLDIYICYDLLYIVLFYVNFVGTKERNIPYPDSNPFSMLFSFVSCPNYTYEVHYLQDQWVFAPMHTE